MPAARRPRPRRVFLIGRELIRQSLEDDVPGLAAELAYRFFLSLFPLFIIMGLLGGFVASALGIEDPTKRIIDVLGGTLPPGAAGLVESQLSLVVDRQHSGFVSVGLVLALWVVAGGANAVVKAVNRAYAVKETRHFWKRWAVALGLTLFASGALVAAFGLIIASVYVDGAAGTPGALERVFGYVRWPVVVLLLMGTTAILYWAAPNVALPWRWVTPGSVLFTLGWLAITTVFAGYVASLGRYEITYGALGGAAILLIWFYLTAYILVLGAELNAILDEEADPTHLARRRREALTESAERGIRPTPYAKGAVSPSLEIGAVSPALDALPRPASSALPAADLPPNDVSRPTHPTPR